MLQHTFSFESELQYKKETKMAQAKRRQPLQKNIMFHMEHTVSEKLAQYGSSALSGVEHLTLLVGKESVALALVRHFGSLKALSRASFRELRQT